MAQLPLATAQAVTAEVKRRLIFVGADGRRRNFAVIPVGSVRRQAPWVKDIDFLVVAPASEAGWALAAATLRPPRAGDVISFGGSSAAGPRRRSLTLRAEGRRTAVQRYRVDFFVTTAAEKPYALYHFTGPKEYNIRIRAHTKRRGWRLNQYGLFNVVTGGRVPGSNVRSEKALSEFIGVTYRPPQLRHCVELRRTA